MNPHTLSIGGSNKVRVALLILASALAWISGAALFVSSRGLDRMLPLPGMRYVMIFAHFAPWLAALAFFWRLRRQGTASQDRSYAAWETLIVMLVLAYIALLDVELTLVMALRHG